jgi:hypothetical protein
MHFSIGTLRFKILNFISPAILFLSLLSLPVVAQKNAPTSSQQTKAGKPAGEVTVEINQQILNSVLQAMFEDSETVSIPLSKTSAIDSNKNSQSSNSCPSEVMLMREVAGVKTEVKFTEGKISAPIAFNGSYSLVLIGCINFKGWADTSVDLVFNKSQQTLSARVKVHRIHLEDIPSLINDNLVNLIQDSIDSRVNPVTLLRTDQLSSPIPMPKGKPSKLHLRATEIRPEIVPEVVKLHIRYEVVRKEQK